jgi:ParB family transcriptional regulator, chromosome partitioning protein
LIKVWKANFPPRLGGGASRLRVGIAAPFNPRRTAVSLKRIALDAIEPNPEQPRAHFDDAALRELANSIHARGLKQPVTVRPIGDGRFQLVMGERRWRAHCLLRDEGKLAEPTIMAHVRRTSDEDMALDAIVENLARADLTVLEEAQAFQRLIDAGQKPAQIAKEIGVQKWRVNYRLQLIALDPSIQDALVKGEITSPVAHELGKLTDHAEQRRLLALVMQGSLANETQVRIAVQQLKKGDGQPAETEEGSPAGSEAEVAEPKAEKLAKMTALEDRVDKILATLSDCWSGDDCVIAHKVAPGRAALVAEKLASIRLKAKRLENELRTAAVAGTLEARPTA